MELKRYSSKVVHGVVAHRARCPRFVACCNVTSDLLCKCCDVSRLSKDSQSLSGLLRDVIIEVMVYNTLYIRIKHMKYSES
jgi:hypothetical protein